VPPGTFQPAQRPVDLAFRRRGPPPRSLASPLPPATQASQTAPVPGLRQPARCEGVPVLCGTPSQRPGPPHGQDQGETRTAPSWVPRVPPSAEGGTAPGDGRRPAGRMRQLRSSQSRRRTRRVPAARALAPKSHTQVALMSLPLGRAGRPWKGSVVRIGQLRLDASVPRTRCETLRHNQAVCPGRTADDDGG
jgi:hypothetical protein